MYKYTKLSLVDRLLIATPLSIVLNYVLVSLLVVVHGYTQFVMLMVIALEIGVLLALSGRGVPQMNQVSSMAVQIKGALQNTNYLALLFNLLALNLLVYRYQITAGSVFDAWDAVMSWNRWAMDWSLQSPGNTVGYPPGLPILYSLIYKLAGTTNLQTIAKLVAAYFPFFGLFCFWRLGHLYKEHSLALSIAGVIYIYLLSLGWLTYGPRFIFAGYSDPIMAALGAFVLYALYIVSDRVRAGYTNQEMKYAVSLVLGAVSGIAMVKQSGVPVALLFAAMTVYLLRGNIKVEKRYWIGVALTFGVLIASYYVYNYIRWHSFVRADNLMGGMFFLRPAAGFKMLLEATGYGLFVLVGIALFIDKTSRNVFQLLLVPMFLFWAFLVSYDLRAAMVFFPWLAVLAGVSLAKMAEFGKPRLLIFFSIACYVLVVEAYSLHQDVIPQWSLDTSAKICLAYIVMWLLFKIYSANCHIIQVRRGGVYLVGLLAMCLAVLPLAKDSESLLADNTLKRIRSNDLGFNERLSRLFENEPSAKMVSCFQLIYNLPASEGRFIPWGDCGLNLVGVWAARSDIEYYLAHPRDKVLLQQTRELLTSKGIRFTEEKLPSEFTLFKRI